MSTLLQEAVMEQAAAKFGCYGPQGSGKTSLVVQLALGLAITHHDKKPIAFFDTEKGSDAAKVMFDAEGVKMLRVKSRAFSDLLAVVKEAERAGCCALIVDSMTHVWNEIIDSYCAANRIKRVEFQHWREIKQMWRQWTDLMLNSPLHMLIAGRAGNVYEYQENQEGKKELITTGTKMKAEGEFGYEPDVLAELWLERKDAKRKGSHLVHKCIVLKDRYWTINGAEFTWKDATAYVPGQWQAVYKCFAPYFDHLNIGGVHKAIDASRNSDELFDGQGNGDYYRQQKLKLACLEDWDATMSLIWPGQTAAEKKARMLVGEAVTTLRSRTRIEQLDVAQLQHCVGVLLAVERRMKDQVPNSEAELLTLVEMAKEDFRAGYQETTLLEAMGRKSCERVAAEKANGGERAEAF